MNAPANRTYDLRADACPTLTDEATPTNSFVTRLVASLTWIFDLDDHERELARQLLFGRPLAVVAQRLGVSTARVQRLCKSLFYATGAEGRQQLFELALRLTDLRELSDRISNKDAAAAWPSRDHECADLLPFQVPSANTGAAHGLRARRSA